MDKQSEQNNSFERRLIAAAIKQQELIQSIEKCYVDIEIFSERRALCTSHEASSSK